MPEEIRRLSVLHRGALRLLVLAVVLAACSGPRAETGAAVPSTPEPQSHERQAVIHKPDLDRFLDQGLHKFNAQMRLQPVVAGRKFIGYKILEMRDPALREHGVGPGDVVLQVNGSDIERPEQWMAIWEGLRTATEVRVDLVRAGSPVRVAYPIVP